MIYNSSIKKDYDEIEKVRMSLTSRLREHDIDMSFIPNFEMAVYETLVNILEHTSLTYPDHSVDIECHVSEQRVRIEISNYGDKFDLNETAMPDIDEHYRNGKRRGLGIYFIRTLMDKVEYTYANRINRTTLIKDIK